MAAPDKLVDLYDPSHILKKDMVAAVENSLRHGAPRLTELEIYNVTSRTPQDTGALQQDIHGVANKNKETLAYIYEGTENQLDEWGRIYAQYQEGGFLGKSTFTNAPHEMFYRGTTDDVEAIRAWGQTTLTLAMATIANGGNP